MAYNIEKTLQRQKKYIYYNFLLRSNRSVKKAVLHEKKKKKWGRERAKRKGKANTLFTELKVYKRNLVSMTSDGIQCNKCSGDSRKFF